MKKFLFLILQCVVLLCVSTLPAISSAENEYSFSFLKDAEAPKPVTVIKQKGILPNEDKVQKGVLFSYKKRSAKSIKIAGNFNSWKPIPMTRGKNGVWYYFLAEYKKGSDIKYKIIDDGIWLADPLNPLKTDDGTGSYVSISTINFSNEGKHISYRFLNKSKKEKKTILTEFRIYNQKASYIAVCGDFNNWNPENDPLTKGDDGIWRIRLHIPEGVYRYKFMIDGKWSVDLYNSDTASDGMGGICSILRVNKETIKQKLEKEPGENSNHSY